MQSICEDLDISTKSNRVDIGVRVELPAVIFRILPTNYMRAKLFTAQRSLRTESAHFV